MDPSVVRSLFDQGYSDTAISEYFLNLFPGQRGFAPRSVRRMRQEMGLTRAAAMDDQSVDVAVKDAVAALGPKSGRRYVKGFLDANGVRIAERRIGNAMRQLDPFAYADRRLALRRNVNPIPYQADYFGHRLHIDQNEKLQAFGVCHVGAIDGYSGYVVASTTMPIKNNLIIYEDIFRHVVTQYGLFDQIVVDGGKEFALTLAAQVSLAPYRTRPDRNPIRRTSSTKNNRIERCWVEVNERVNYPVKAVVEDLIDHAGLDMSDGGQKFCCSTVCCAVTSAGLSKLFQARNHHYIPGRGKPVDLMRYANPAILDPNLVPPVDQAAEEYRSNGGTLTDPHTFGTDPLHGQPALLAERATAVNSNHMTPAEIHGYVLNGHPTPFCDYPTMFLNTTAQICGRGF